MLGFVFHLVKSDRVWNHRLVSPYLTVWNIHSTAKLFAMFSEPVNSTDLSNREVNRESL